MLSGQAWVGSFCKYNDDIILSGRDEKDLFSFVNKLTNITKMCDH